jgi:hypothetical protein
MAGIERPIAAPGRSEMIGRRRATFSALHGLLRGVEADPENHQLVLTLNKRILAAVLMSERAILRLKKIQQNLREQLRRHRKPKEETTAIRSRIANVQSLIDSLYDQIYVWKCFGDGLIFSYLDRFAVKHAHLETDSQQIKQGAQMLTGKSGLAREILLLEAAITHNVPAVLCDITNVVRYGDVCLLGSSDPYLLEAKSGKRLNQRGKRQASSLKRLTKFLETDQAEDFRGVGNVQRAEVHAHERTHLEVLNRCIEEAKGQGHAVVSPEPGLSYIAIYDSDAPIEKIIPFTREGHNYLFMLNAAKRDWSYYYPFTLSIHEAEHLHDFIIGDVTLIVIVDVATLCNLVRLPGWTILFRNEDHSIDCQHAPSGCGAQFSGQFVARIGYEFLSLAWFAEQMQQRLEGAVMMLNGSVILNLLRKKSGRYILRTTESYRMKEANGEDVECPIDLMNAERIEELLDANQLVRDGPNKSLLP